MNLGIPKLLLLLLLRPTLHWRGKAIPHSGRLITFLYSLVLKWELTLTLAGNVYNSIF